MRLLAVGWDADPPYYVMEYLPDGSLADRLAADGPLPTERAVDLAQGVAAGLIHAHGSGILHCDLKPGNVLLDRDGSPRLCDFGQARGFGPGTSGSGSGAAGSQTPALGTLFYMPPEQTLPGAAPDARWDVYALGALLFEWSDRPPAAPHRRRRRPAPRPRHARGPAGGVPGPGAVEPEPGGGADGGGRGAAVSRAARCLAADPADRFPNAQAVRDALLRRGRAAARRAQLRRALLAPAGLALALAPVAVLVGDGAVDAAREQVLRRAVDANALSARVVARSLEREVDRKREDLEDLAARARLVDLVERADADGWEPGEARDELWTFLDANTTVQSGDDPRTEDTSWFLTDAAGVQRWRDPRNAVTLGRNFAFRDYYHGRGAEYPPDGVPADISPVERTYVSHPFRSDATGG